MRAAERDFAKGDPGRGSADLAHRDHRLLVTCNRDDFLTLAETQPDAGIIVLIRRDSRLAECAALLRLLDKAGETGLADNINFA